MKSATSYVKPKAMRKRNEEMLTNEGLLTISKGISAYSINVAYPGS